MTIILRHNDSNSPVETEMELVGQAFPITLLPLPLKDQFQAFAQFRKKRNVPNPVTGRMELVDYFDDKDARWQQVTEDLLDRHVIDFKCIAGPDGKELDGTLRANKILLGNVKVRDQEEVKVIDPETREEAVILRPRIRAFSALIFDKCNELAETIAEISEKN